MKIGDFVHFKYNSRHNDFSQPYIVEDIIFINNQAYMRIKQIEKAIYSQKLKSRTISDFLLYLDTGEYDYYIRTKKIERLCGTNI